MDTQRVDQLIQFALLIAGENDDFTERDLGPIHLLKYVYLGDLAHAQRNAGESYTGSAWKFYNFGPWSPEVFARIEPAVLALGAERFEFPSDYDDKSSWVRWRMRSSDLLRRLEPNLPLVIGARLKGLVRRYGKDTPALLDFVYRTAPMLSAAPGDTLDIAATAIDPPRLGEEVESPADSSGWLDSLSNKKRKKFRAGMKALRENIRRGPRKHDHTSETTLRYERDESFAETVSWLDSLAGDPIPEGEIELEFGEDVWHSAPRKGEDVP